jgi:uncharacterized protein YbbC (DUF1343 family)
MSQYFFTCVFCEKKIELPNGLYVRTPEDAAPCHTSCVPSGVIVVYQKDELSFVQRQGDGINETVNKTDGK